MGEGQGVGEQPSQMKQIRKTVCISPLKRREEKMVCCQENNEEVMTNV